ncbi:MAG: shikimate dehydrogenase family protein [Candidatus Kapaibacterium sp.]
MKMLKAALLGRSLPRSISPEVHRELFSILRAKLDAEYDAIDYTKIECRDEAEFRSLVESGTSDGFVGFNVTFPYKFAAATMAGESSALVQKIHSANMITCSTPLRIISTDGDGFRFAMEKFCRNLSYSEYSLAILGAGGAARAVLHALHDLGWRKITIAARSFEEARRSALPYPSVTVLPLDEFRRDAAPQFIVQATPVGQRGRETLLETFEWKPGDIAVDLVYNPLRTLFLDLAEQGGAQAVDGLGMLIEQAALSQYFWMTGFESATSVLSMDEFQMLHTSLSKLLIPRWDASDI